MSYVPRFYYIPAQGIVKRCMDVWNLETTPQTDKILCLFKNVTLKNLPAQAQEEQVAYKAILRILNKITMKKFHKLITEIDLDSMDDRCVTLLAHSLFAKVLDDEIYLSMYCKLIGKIISTLSNGDRRMTFKSILMEFCETGMKHLLELTDKQMEDIEISKRFFHKKRLMILMRFIGEMACLEDGFCDMDYVYTCISNLLSISGEIHLEAVYYLLYTSYRRSKVGLNWDEHIWEAVIKISKGLNIDGSPVSNRIRFMFLSLVEAKIGIITDRSVKCNTVSSSGSSESDCENEQCTVRGN